MDHPRELRRQDAVGTSHSLLCVHDDVPHAAAGEVLELRALELELLRPGVPPDAELDPAARNSVTSSGKA